MKTKTKRDYVAKITYYGLSEMNKKELTRVAKWLETRLKEIKQLPSKKVGYVKVYSSRLMK